MMLLQNEQRVFSDMRIALMIYVAHKFGLKPEAVQVTWKHEDGKWFSEVALPQIDGVSDETIREGIASVYRSARVNLAQYLKQNRQTRFHG